MGIHFPGKSHVKQILRRSLSWKQATVITDVPRGHFAIYVGEAEKRFIVPISYLKHPWFKNLLDRAEEEFGFNYQMGGLRVPCEETTFMSLACQLKGPLEE